MDGGWEGKKMCYSVIISHLSLFIWIHVHSFLSVWQKPWKEWSKEAGNKIKKRFVLKLDSVLRHKLNGLVVIPFYHINEETPMVMAKTAAGQCQNVNAFSLSLSLFFRFPFSISYSPTFLLIHSAFLFTTASLLFYFFVVSNFT